MHCWISACGYTASIACGKPVRPSTHVNPSCFLERKSMCLEDVRACFLPFARIRTVLGSLLWNGLVKIGRKKIDTLQSRVYNKCEYGGDNIVRTFIEVPLFTRRWKEIGLSDDELLALQIMLLKDPESGPVMESTGGIRKVRFPVANRGKSHSENRWQAL